ncbi:uncharacterized protein CG1552 isoform X1 [Drosophila novamexicana]|uniref:Uncharacterized protein, isoform B n=1 Tax=Drosophila virilis TaxID=7244 RepID=A0A0Q9WQK9_DROVI|nr:uncharacterized protein CG1552 isoform X1 [Drosophila virilis]XP_030568562.1 uncharacterized protein CG1552 isoform X1 [Drosophila novamexicana]KRF82629.1 uncharacterized protein Dvir_GJ15942, isoform B [Drosophila virilis]
MYVMQLVGSLAVCLLVWLCSCDAFGQFHMKRYHLQRGYSADDSSESDNSVLRTYRRCMWEQSKFLPRRLVLLSLCSNLFCENNQIMPRSRSIFVVEKISRPNDCLDILPDQCEQGDEEDLMYKPFPDCCPVYCNLKRRMQRLRTMHLRHRLLRNLQDSVISAAAAGSADGNTLLSEIGYNY